MLFAGNPAISSVQLTDPSSRHQTLYFLSADELSFQVIQAVVEEVATAVRRLGAAGGSARTKLADSRTANKIVAHGKPTSGLRRFLKLSRVNWHTLS